jgi:hypothetical protein
MLAAAAALKWPRSPPAVWKRKGLGAMDILRSVEARLSQVIAGLRFLGCVALFQHCAEPSLLGSQKLVEGLERLTGFKVRNADKQSSVAASMDELLKPGLQLDTNTLPQNSSAKRHKPDAAWDLFFKEAVRRPTDAVVLLLKELHGGSHDSASKIGLPGKHLAMPVLPQAVLSTYDDDEEVVSIDASGRGDCSVSRWTTEDFSEATKDDDGTDGFQIVVPL